MLEVEEQNLQVVLNRINGDIAGVEKQINETEVKQAATEESIAQSKVTLEQQRQVLGKNVKAMYHESKITSLEMLASSKNLSDYMDKEQYRTSVQNKITATLEKVRALQAQLEKEQADLKVIAADLSSMQSHLDGQRSEQQRLLSLNQDQQAEFEAQLNTNNAQIAELRRQQIAENSRFNNPGSARVNIPYSSGYPWANAPFPNSVSDPWGMYLRQCVSYTAWKVHASGRNMPYWGGFGNAKQWDDNAIAAGIPVDRNPRVGDVAVSNRGYYGHVMYVEAVYGDGTIYISQYNASWDGAYSEARIPIGDLVFIHF